MKVLNPFYSRYTGVVVVALIGLFGVVYEYVVYGCRNFRDVGVSGTPFSSGYERDFVANY
jgi:hypothetical protein